MYMLAALLLGAHTIQGDARTYDLFRGAALAGQPLRYWDVTDTYLDSSLPQKGFGGEGVLVGGPGKSILIRFGDLQRVVAGGTVKSATLILTPSGGDVPQLRSVSRLLVPFGEGPVNTIGAILAGNAAGPNAPQAAPWASTWSARRMGANLNWQSAGASGNGDATPIDSARFSAGEDTVSITGLATAVQHMADHPEDNNGFLLNFSNGCEFNSANTFGGRPRLVLEVIPKPTPAGADLSVQVIEQSGRTPGANATFIARIKNNGTAPAEGVTAQWISVEKPGANAPIPSTLAVGQTVTVPYERPFVEVPGDHRTQPLAIEVRAANDVNPANNRLSVPGTGRLLKVAADPALADAIQAQVRFFNETLAPQSRFSFAREGALERVAIQSIAAEDASADLRWDQPLTVVPNPDFQRAILHALGLPNLSQSSFPAGTRNALTTRGSVDPFPGILGYGDTRFEGTIPGMLALLYEPYSNASLDFQPLEPTDLLSATDVALINKSLDGAISIEQALNAMTTTVILRALDIMGRPLSGMELSFFQSQNGEFHNEPPAFTVVTDTKGSVTLPNREGKGPFGVIGADGGNGVFLVRASANGTTEWGWLKAWQLVDSLSRGGTGATVFDMRFNLPGAPVDETLDLVRERIVTDSAKSLPAKLAAIVDGDPATVADLGGKESWFEVDLGRDRTISQIDVLANPDQMWQKFDIVVYSTGQDAATATMWAREVKWDWTSANRRDTVNGVNAVAYRGVPLKIRYIRFINRTDQTGQLTGVRVLPAKI